MFSRKDKKQKITYLHGFSPTLVLVVFFLLLSGGFLFSSGKLKQEPLEETNFVFSEQSFLVPVSSPENPPLEVVSRYKTVITAYSSTPDQTDDTPFITASNKKVEDGIVANNYLPFGTKVRIPEIYGDKIFVVEDRMHSRKSDYQFDIWFSDHDEAVEFGAERTYVEILGR